MHKQIIALITSALVWTMSPAFAMEGSEKNHEKSICKAPTWDFLKEGDTIAIIAPSAAPSDQQVEAAKKLIILHGLKAFLPEEAINRDGTPSKYYANSHEERANYFREAINGEAKAIWAIRGGFGGAEVLAILERAPILPPIQPKPIVGFSDTTALHLLADTWGWATLHAPVLGFGKELVSVTESHVNENTNLSTVIRILKGKKKEVEYTFNVIHPGSLPSEDPIRGSVVGGNLTIIENHKGTPTALNGENRFIFIEDTAEYFNRLSRTLVGLKRCGVFDKAKAIIFGNLPIRGHEDSQDETKKEIHNFVQQFLLPETNIPVLYSSSFGHGKDNNVMPLGTKATLWVGTEEAILKVKVNKRPHLPKSIGQSL
ncbi:MAG TPA: LD-carboxypeptidase [Alphaproteobacteria bacterium]|nr:LD-carboxypeptidase [Alphaproteobacteria bacterium]